jgi:hypothetical protein
VEEYLHSEWWRSTSMKPLALESPLARRFAEALECLDTARTRIEVEVYAAAFLAAEPALATSPERRPRLAATVQELVGAGVLRASRVVDRSELPHLPRFVVLQNRVTDLSVGSEVAAYPWRPELAWAARVTLRRSEFDALQSVQKFLRERGTTAPVVPTGERSLELFADEKRLDALRRNRRLFGPGRLSLDLLRARSYAPPFAFRRIGQGEVALVLENVATFRSMLATLPPDSPVGMVVFGGGANFAQSVLYFLELAEASHIEQIRYFGDLDRRGLQIPILADTAARDVGLPAVRPAIGLWAKLLRLGRLEPHESVDAETADGLVAWLPASLRAAASTVLCSGMRLAQEAVGTEVLQQDDLWSTWSGLGPPAAHRAGDTDASLRRPYPSFTKTDVVQTDDAALLLDDSGERREPTDDREWLEWIGAGRTRNWILGDPILDWLALYGRDNGFVPDDERPAYDARTDFRQFVLERGVNFEVGVTNLLERRCPVVRVASCRDDSRSLERARETLAALRAGVPVVAQGVLRNPNRQTYGVPDLLVRSDILATWFPEMLSAEEASISAPLLGHSFHYRAVDIKFHTFDITSDGHVSTSRVQLAYAAQVWIYTEALGRLQGFTPPAGYLIGRTWKQGDEIGAGCLDRLARVDMDRWLPSREAAIYDLVQEAVTWVRRLRRDGRSWRVLPEPSVVEIYPHARNTEDAPWHTAKREICQALGELTLIPGMNPERRALAHAIGIKRADDPNASAARLGITSPLYAARADAVLAANRSSVPTVLPERIVGHSEWREVPALEFYVDFETVSNLDDDFIHLPRVGGNPQIVQIGSGHIGKDGSWVFTQWTVDSVSATEERRIIDAWVGDLLAACRAHTIPLSSARICHWSAAEPVNLETAYNAARKRHPDASWPTELPWFDVLERLIRAEPIAVTGAFNFGLKSIARGMHAAGRITTVWTDGPTDGLGAMVAMWSAARESASASAPVSSHPLALEVARYNEVDCLAMCEILTWLRANR